MTTAVKETCPRCGSTLVWQYASYDISQREPYCSCCGFRPVVAVLPKPPYEKESHMIFSEKKIAKIRRELAGDGDDPAR